MVTLKLCLEEPDSTHLNVSKLVEKTQKAFLVLTSIISFSSKTLTLKYEVIEVKSYLFTFPISTISLYFLIHVNHILLTFFHYVNKSLLLSFGLNYQGDLCVNKDVYKIIHSVLGYNRDIYMGSDLKF